MTTAYNQGKVPAFEMRHRLARAREVAGYSRAELADAIDVSRNTITNAETGKTTPRKLMLNIWALACGVPVDWLITGIDPNGGDDDPDGGLLLPRMDSNHQPSDLSAFAQRKRRYGPLDPKTRQAA